MPAEKKRNGQKIVSRRVTGMGGRRSEMQKRYIDLHTDTASAVFDRKKSIEANDLHVDLRRAEMIGEYIPFLTLFTDSSRHEMKGRYEELSENLLREAEGRVGFVASGEELKEVRGKGLLPAMRAVEGAEMLLSDPDRMKRAARDDALLMSGITWNNPNPLWWENGLTEKGRAYVSACAEAGVAVDVSHLNDAGTMEILSMGIPAVASHSDARALCQVRRNLPDDLIRHIGQNGGLIGMNFCASFIAPDPEDQTLRRLAEHAAHIAEIAGTGVLALGTDFDGAQLPRNVHGVQDLPLFAEALSDLGFSPLEIDGLCYGNAFRYFFEERKG